MTEKKLPKIYCIDTYFLGRHYATGRLEDIAAFYKAAKIKVEIEAIEIGHISPSDTRNKSKLEALAKKFDDAHTEYWRLHVGN